MIWSNKTSEDFAKELIRKIHTERYMLSLNKEVVSNCTEIFTKWFGEFKHPSYLLNASNMFPL